MTNPLSRGAQLIKTASRRVQSRAEETPAVRKGATLTVEVWYDPASPDLIQLSSEDARLTDEQGRRKGILIGVNVNKQPRTFARLDALLQSEGLTRP